jgi:hypothetical protein
MALRLLDHRLTDCCAADVSADIEVDTHRDLARYLTLNNALLALPVPAELFEQTALVLGPHLPAADQMTRRRDGSAYVITDLTSTVITALRQLPQLECSVSTPEHELRDDPAELVLSVVDTDPASISWRVCWPDQHNEAGFELGLNGVEMWHSDPPPGHSLYVHVSPRDEEQAHALAAAVGGSVHGSAAQGW